MILYTSSYLLSYLFKSAKQKKNIYREEALKTVIGWLNYFFEIKLVKLSFFLMILNLSKDTLNMPKKKYYSKYKANNIIR